MSSAGQRMPECLESLTLAPTLRLCTQEVAPCGHGCAEPPVGPLPPASPTEGTWGAFQGPVLGTSAWERPRSPRAPCSWAQGCVWRGASSLCWLTFAVAPGGAGALTEHFVSPGAMLCFSPPPPSLLLGLGVSLACSAPLCPPRGDPG